MYRHVVYRHEMNATVNVNDEIGLDTVASYTIKEYLHDLAHEEGRRVTGAHGTVFVFSDGSTEALEQKYERIPLGQLDEETRSLVLDEAVTFLPQLVLPSLLLA